MTLEEQLRDLCADSSLRQSYPDAIRYIEDYVLRDTPSIIGIRLRDRVAGWLKGQGA